MLSDEQIKVIRKYVPDNYFNQDKLIDYLNVHDVVGVEVFEYVAKKVWHVDCFQDIVPIGLRGSKTKGYKAVSVETFIKRIPIYFYMKSTHLEGDDIDDEEDVVWQPLAIADVLYCVGDKPFSGMIHYRDTPLTLEDAMNKLEYLFYDRGYTLAEIYHYPGYVADTTLDAPFGDWFDYIDMCIELGWNDFMPDRFYAKYNEAREALGKPPIIFTVEEYNSDAWEDNCDKIEFYQRNGNQIRLYGRFPCDAEGKPILNWIAVQINEVDSISCECIRSGEGEMIIEVTPRSVIDIQVAPRDEIGNPIDDCEPEWKRIYAGPQTMDFNFEVLRRRRKELGYTQHQVAEAVGANIRTYQKWENGETKPDGYYLLRMMNWLDIRDIGEVTLFKEL